MKLAILTKFLLLYTTVCIAELPYSLKFYVHSYLLSNTITFTTEEIRLGNGPRYKYDQVIVRFLPVDDAIHITIIPMADKHVDITMLCMNKPSKLSNRSK